MTVTKRKQKPRETGGPDTAVSAPQLESGMKATCDACSTDITHTVHIRCAEKVGERLTCPDFDLCVDCFLHGKSLGPHRATHAYRVISSHAFPIFNRDWGADEELLLLEGAEMYGLGNWADIAEHVGGRTKEECHDHYVQTYLESDEYPLPRIETDFSPLDAEPFQQRKKARLEELQSRPIPLPPPKPLASAPTCHEIAGYMPGRLEFEHEYENEAEVLIKDMVFGKVYHFGGEDQPEAPPPVAGDLAPPSEQPGSGAPAEGGAGEGGAAAAEAAAAGEEEKPLPDGEKDGDEPEAELDLKLAILEMFNERYDKRMAAKELIFDRGLINYKILSAAERKRSKEERDLIMRTKVFSRIQTAQDHEDFVEGLLYEITLRKRIAELQEYRRNGVTTLVEADRFEQAKQSRTTSRAASYRESISLAFDRSGSASRRPTPTSGGAGAGFVAQQRARPAPPLTLANAASLQLLSPLETQLCSTLRILPRPYLFLKEVLLREWVRLKGRMGPREARRAVVREQQLVGPDGEVVAGDGGDGAQGEWGEKIERVWEFVRDAAGLAGAGGAGDDDEDDADADADEDAVMDEIAA
ncbi:chromatin-binding transcription regulator ADA2 [Rhodotorula paludigena]|uniref:chromatin-binding transcription regulator ADA2 n=1 Tax=Rhodotorula paludigena TaxID=86838 RepID=UPI00316F4628